MKTSKKLILVPAAICVLSAAIIGCSHSSKPTASIDDRTSFKGGPMPASVGQIIAQRAHMTAAQAAAHPATAQ